MIENNVIGEILIKFTNFTIFLMKRSIINSYKSSLRTAVSFRVTGEVFFFRDRALDKAFYGGPSNRVLLVSVYAVIQYLRQHFVLTDFKLVFDCTIKDGVAALFILCFLNK